MDNLNHKKTAIIIVDAWDKHWCKSFTHTLNNMCPKINTFKEFYKKKGCLIIHCPSDCINFYNKNKLKHHNIKEIENNLFKKRPLQPDPYTYGCCCDNPCQNKNKRVWKRQHSSIKIDDDDYIIDDNKQNLYNIIKTYNIENLIYTGFALNMCILGRNIGIKTTSKWDINIYISKKHTDIFYNVKYNKELNTRQEAINFINDYYEDRNINILH